MKNKEQELLCFDKVLEDFHKDKNKSSFLSDVYYILRRCEIKKTYKFSNDECSDLFLLMHEAFKISNDYRIINFLLKVQDKSRYLDTSLKSL